VEDKELVQKVLAGDPAAQELLVKLHREPLRRTCVHILGWEDPEVEDVVQETFARAFTNLSGFEFRSSLGHWLRRICTNLCFRRYRKRKRLVLQAQEDLEGLFTPKALAVEEEKEREIEKARRLEALARGKEGLGKPCRDLVGLRDEQGRSYAEISNVLRVPMGTVMSRLARCRQTLRELVMKVLSGGMDA